VSVYNRPDAGRLQLEILERILAGGIVAGAAVWFLMRPSAPHITRFAITPSGSAAVTAIAADPELAITPDGTHIVYVGNNGTQLFVRALDQIEPTPLAGLGAPRGPFLSPDGKWIGFFDNTAGQTQALKKVAVAGGPPLPVCRYSGQRQGGTWGEDDTIIFATGDTSSGLWRVSEVGGEPTMLTKPNREHGENDHLWPEFLPAGRAVLFTITPTTGGIENSRIAVLDLRTGTQKILVPGGSHAHYVSDHLVYGVAGTLRAVAFNLSRLEVTGTPIPVLAQVVTTNTGAADFDVAHDGTLVYVLPSASIGTLAPWTLVWVDRQGREEPLKTPMRPYADPRISPDGTRIALDVLDLNNDIWNWDLARETLTPFTFDPGLDTNPVWWTPGLDRRLVFSSEHAGNRNLFWQNADGTGGLQRLSESPNQQVPTSISPDGTHLVFTEVVSAAKSMMMVTLNKEHRVQPLAQVSGFNEQNGEISPDGRWLAYESSDSRQAQIYVRPFPVANGDHWQVSMGGGVRPVWSRNGHELFYMTNLTAVAAEGTVAMMSVTVEHGATWTAGPPTKVFEGQYFVGGGANVGTIGRMYDVSPDGRFLMIKQSGLANLGEGQTRRVEEGLIVVQNWVEELKRLVPTK
jgi:serine/threonine-protein kinase